MFKPKTNPILKTFRSKKPKLLSSTPKILLTNENGYFSSRGSKPNNKDKKKTNMSLYPSHRQFLSNIQESKKSLKSELNSSNRFSISGISGTENNDSCSNTISDVYWTEHTNDCRNTKIVSLLSSPSGSPHGKTDKKIDYSILAQATDKLKNIMEKKKENRQRSYDKKIIQMATNKLQSILESSTKKRNCTCSKPKRRKESDSKNKYSFILKEKEKLNKILKLESIIVSRKSLKKEKDCDTNSTVTYSENNQTPKSNSNRSLSPKGKEVNVTSTGYTLEYMLSFKTNPICKITNLLDGKVLNHIQAFSIFEEVKNDNTGTLARGSNVNTNTQLNYNTNNTVKNNDISEWGRKDFTKEISKAEAFVNEFHSKINNDPIKSDITSILNTLTVDNYANVKKELFDIIKKSNDNQTKFIEVLLKKAIMEKFYVSLYAKLCKELNDSLSELKENENSKKTFLRYQLIDSCKNIFMNHNLIIDSNVNDVDIEIKEKKKMIGNVQLIAEFIKVKMLSQKIGFFCIKNLLDRFYDESLSAKERFIFLESLVVLLDNFGKLVYERQNSDYISRINSFLNEDLTDIQKNNKLIPSFIKYKIINLLEKRNNSWRDTLFEQATVAKGKNETYTPIKTETSCQIKHEAFSPIKTELFNPIKTEAYNPIEEDLHELKEAEPEIRPKKGYEEENDEEDNLILIKKDLKDWFKFYNIDSSELINVDDYKWDVVDEMVKNKIKLGEIIRIFLEASIDLVDTNKKVIKACKYIRIIIDYYSQFLLRNELDELSNNIMKFFIDVNDLIVDNNNLINILGHILFCAITNKIIVMKKFNLFEEKSKETIKNICKLVKVAIDVDLKKRKRMLNDFKQVKVFKDNEKIFNEVINN